MAFLAVYPNDTRNWDTMAGRPATASDRKNVPRYRFSEFILSPRRRMLLRNGREQPLIPRYFDLLVFLIERRGEAVHRRDIFDRVWSDVVVSDSALSQAIRTIRRTLGDESREPRFIRTVSRHGYHFVFADVVEEDDEGEWQIVEPGRAPTRRPSALRPRIPSSRCCSALTARRDNARRGRGAARSRRAAARAGYVGGLAAPRHPSAPRVRASAAARYALGLAEAGPVPILGQPAPFGDGSRAGAAAAAARRDNRRRPMGAGVARRRPRRVVGGAVRRR